MYISYAPELYQKLILEFFLLSCNESVVGIQQLFSR